jgi:opacity protein-like surface antigen
MKPAHKATRPYPGAIFVITNSLEHIIIKTIKITVHSLRNNEFNFKRRTSMKKIMIIIAVVLLALSTGTQAFAKSEQMGNAEVDASLVWASAPASAFDSTIGLAIGGGIILPQIDKNLQARVDITFLSFDGSFFGTDLTYTRVPITVSGRYYIPANQDIKVYAQGGAEVSFDKVEAGVPGFPGFKTSESDINFGLVAGVGIDVAITPQLSFVADARLHMITDYYLTFQGGVALHF